MLLLYNNLKKGCNHNIIRNFMKIPKDPKYDEK